MQVEEEVLRIVVYKVVEDQGVEEQVVINLLHQEQQVQLILEEEEVVVGFLMEEQEVRV
jgi:hypothetical protein